LPGRAGKTRDSRRALALLAISLGTYLFLYAPIAILILFSFNKSRTAATFTGVTLGWYAQALNNAQILGALKNSLIFAIAATVLATIIGTAAALAFHRYKFRSEAALTGLITVPMVVPEIVLASSLLLLFASVGLALGSLAVILSHVSFTVSYVVIVVRARLAGFDRSLEEAAMDLGAGPWRTMWRVTLPLIAPGIVAAALLVFSLSIDDYLVTSFVAGVGSTTLPVQIYSMVRSGVSPEINAISTLLLVATSLILYGSFRLERGASIGRASLPALLGIGLLAAPFVLGGHAAAGDRVLNLYIWSNYISPDTIKKFEARHNVRVNVDLYDSNEALLAKMQSASVDYDIICPTNYAVEILARQHLLATIDHRLLPHLGNLDPGFLDRPHDRGNQRSIPYVWGTGGVAYDRTRVGDIDSWAALWDRKWAGKILMLDDPRETLGAALRRLGHSYNTKDAALLEQAKQMLIEQKPLVRAYSSSNFDAVLQARDVWIAQGWSGQFAKVIDEDPRIAYMVPKEGSSLFLDSLAIPASSKHQELAHAFIDFTLEAEIAAEICTTMKYSTPNRAALAFLPAAIRNNPAIFPPPDVLSRAELIEDIGEATVLYDRLWTEVKTSR
jgi:spermidine/putrescine transport system permease protein